MEEELNIAEVKKVLEDADIYEPNMSDDMMVSYYKVITDSKNTASEENETRRLNESQCELLKVLEGDEDVNSTPPQSKEKPFTPKAWVSEKKVLNNDVPERNNNGNLKENNLEDITDSPKDATKETFGFNEMAEDSESILNIISHELKFIPIQRSPNFLNADRTRKAKMLYAYHTKLNRMKGQVARMSFYPAPFPKVTSTTDTFPTFTNELDLQETYISRSGRQTKRKVYNYDEDDDSLDGIKHKKTKNSEEQEWLSKTSHNKSITRSKKPDTNHSSAKIDKPELDTAENNNENNKAPPPPPPKVEAKPPLSKKPTNEEIMKRSRLFGESTPRRRCELMFDKLKEEEEKKQKEEKTIEAFNKTLERVNDSSNENNAEDDIIDVDDEEPVKKRVVPAIPGRRAINNRRRNVAPLNITVNSTTPKRETLTRQASSSNSSQDTVEISPKPAARKRGGQRKASVGDGIENVPSTSRLTKTSSTSNVTCPICGDAFNEKQIEGHAATCGDDSDTRTSKFSRLTCEYCDQVVLIDYDIHLKECSSKNSNNL